MIALGAGAILVFSLTSCTTDIAAAAIVGNTQIKAVDLETRTATLTAQVNQEIGKSDLIDVQRQDLNGRIRHELLADMGLLQSLDATTLLALPDQLGGTQTVAGQLGAFTQDELLVRLQDLASQMALVSTTAQAGTLIATPSVTFDYLRTDTYAKAVDLKSKYQSNPESLTADAVAAGSNGGGVDLVASPLTDGALSPTGIFGSQAGQIVVLALGNTFLVARITKSEVVSAPIDLAALQKAGVPGIQGAAGLILSTVASDVSVEVNPRFGAWDTLTMQVVNEPGRR